MKITETQGQRQVQIPQDIVQRPKIPAGTATAPSQINSLIEELTPRVKDWASDYGKLAPMLINQPDMAIGLRIFHATHFTDSSSRNHTKSLLDILDDVSDWGEFCV